MRTANAAAQSRADYAASVVAAELAEARRDRVASKRTKKRSSPPKTPKRLAWAAQEHLVQHRVFSTVREGIANCLQHYCLIIDCCVANYMWAVGPFRGDVHQYSCCSITASL